MKPQNSVSMEILIRFSFQRGSGRNPDTSGERKGERQRERSRPFHNSEVDRSKSLYGTLHDRKIAFKLHKETQSNAQLGWATMVSVPSCSKKSPTRFLQGWSQMALTERGRYFLHGWCFQEGEVLQHWLCPRYLLISLELFLLLKLSTIEFDCYLGTNSSGKLACKYPVFRFPNIAWTVRSCWSAVPFF